MVLSPTYAWRNEETKKERKFSRSKFSVALFSQFVLPFLVKYEPQVARLNAGSNSECYRIAIVLILNSHKIFFSDPDFSG